MLLTSPSDSTKAVLDTSGEKSTISLEKFEQPTSLKPLDWRDRPAVVKREIDATFDALIKARKQWGFNGASSYDLFGINFLYVLQGYLLCH